MGSAKEDLECESRNAGARAFTGDTHVQEADFGVSDRSRQPLPMHRWTVGHNIPTSRKTGSQCAEQACSEQACYVLHVFHHTKKRSI